MDAEPELTMGSKPGGKNDDDVRWDPDVDGSDDAGEVDADAANDDDAEGRSDGDDDATAPIPAKVPKVKAKDKKKDRKAEEEKQDKNVYPSAGKPHAQRRRVFRQRLILCAPFCPSLSGSIWALSWVALHSMVALTQYTAII